MPPKSTLSRKSRWKPVVRPRRGGVPQAAPAVGLLVRRQLPWRRSRDNTGRGYGGVHGELIARAAG